MRDDECIRFLQWALPNLRMRWPGFRKVCRQVCERVAGRLLDLGLRDTDLVLCRNLVLPYLDERLHREICHRSQTASPGRGAGNRKT